MTMLEQSCYTTTAVLKRAATLLTTTGFFAAAIFLAALVWRPAHAAPASAAGEVEQSVLLALDTPQRPSPKVHLPDPSQMTDEDRELLANLPAPDLATELNSWTYTASPTQILLASLTGYVDSFFQLARGNIGGFLYYQVYSILELAYFGQALGLPIPSSFTAALASLTSTLSVYVSPSGRLSPVT
jgi:hypothetical protein